MDLDDRAADYISQLLNKWSYAWRSRLCSRSRILCADWQNDCLRRVEFVASGPSSVLDDVWYYDVTRNFGTYEGWSTVSDYPLNIATFGTFNAGNSPGARSEHFINLVTGTDLLVVFGGRNNVAPAIATSQESLGGVMSLWQFWCDSTLTELWKSLWVKARRAGKTLNYRSRWTLHVELSSCIRKWLLTAIEASQHIGRPRSTVRDAVLRIDRFWCFPNVRRCRQFGVRFWTCQYGRTVGTLCCTWGSHTISWAQISNLIFTLTLCCCLCPCVRPTRETKSDRQPVINYRLQRNIRRSHTHQIVRSRISPAMSGLRLRLTINQAACDCTSQNFNKCS